MTVFWVMLAVLFIIAHMARSAPVYTDRAPFYEKPNPWGLFLVAIILITVKAAFIEPISRAEKPCSCKNTVVNIPEAAMAQYRKSIALKR